MNLWQVCEGVCHVKLLRQDIPTTVNWRRKPYAEQLFPPGCFSVRPQQRETGLTKVN